MPVEGFEPSRLWAAVFETAVSAWFHHTGITLNILESILVSMTGDRTCLEKLP